jgi:hypothetical protein
MKLETYTSRFPLTDGNLPAFQWAGISFPKYIWTLPRGAKAKRLAEAKAKSCGPYYHAPTPNGKGGTAFYLESDGPVRLRWQWADKVEGVGRAINHTGWFTDEFGDGDKIRGIVFRLPRSRGFLIGWSMGEGMATAMEPEIYETTREAAIAADGLAETVAETERENEAKERQRIEDEEETRLAEMAEEMEMA